ncbi:uncharacterized protein BO88DRAFT_474911, partial [Aspergillus vadensis CBS 113365]
DGQTECGNFPVFWGNPRRKPWIGLAGRLDLHPLLWTIGNMNTSETACVFFFPQPAGCSTHVLQTFLTRMEVTLINHLVDSNSGGGFGSPPLNMRKQMNFHESRQGETRGAGPVTSEQEARGDSGNQSIRLPGDPVAVRGGAPSKKQEAEGEGEEEMEDGKHAKPGCRCIPGIGRVGLRFAGRSLSFWILWIGSCPHRLSCRTVPGLALIG